MISCSYIGIVKLSFETDDLDQSQDLKDFFTKLKYIQHIS